MYDLDNIRDEIESALSYCQGHIWSEYLRAELVSVIREYLRCRLPQKIEENIKIEVKQNDGVIVVVLKNFNDKRS